MNKLNDFMFSFSFALLGSDANSEVLSDFFPQSRRKVLVFFSLIHGIVVPATLLEGH